MRQPHHHIEDTVTSIVVLLVLAVVGFFGLRNDQCVPGGLARVPES